MAGPSCAAYPIPSFRSSLARLVSRPSLCANELDDPQLRIFGRDLPGLSDPLSGEAAEQRAVCVPPSHPAATPVSDVIGRTSQRGRTISLSSDSSSHCAKYCVGTLKPPSDGTEPVDVAWNCSRGSDNCKWSVRRNSSSDFQPPSETADAPNISRNRRPPGTVVDTRRRQPLGLRKRLPVQFGEPDRQAIDLALFRRRSSAVRFGPAPQATPSPAARPHRVPVSNRATARRSSTDLVWTW